MQILLLFSLLVGICVVWLSALGTAEPSQFQVRLMNGSTPNEGRVDVFYNGAWTASCDKGWDERDARVVCRELGYDGITMVTGSSFFSSLETTHIGYFGCYGNETRLSQCPHKMRENDWECRSHYGQAGVICESSSTTDKDLRVKLTGPDNTEGAGVVEVYMDGQWGRVCDNSWDNWDADVVCRQLGFPAAESSTCCGWYFGRGSGPSLMTSVHCEGTEKSLFHCRHTGRNLADCDTSAGVICKLDKPPVRLVGSPVTHAGIVQVRYRGRWGTVCDWDWELTQSHVVCRELGFQRALFPTQGGFFEKQTGPVWLSAVTCTGNESSIMQCYLEYSRDVQPLPGCDHEDDSGVICESNKEPGTNETTPIRLKGGNFSHMGRVEIFREGFWGALCSVAWDLKDADVVCRQLGYPGALADTGHGEFGSITPVWVTTVACQGNETRLDPCFEGGWKHESHCWKRHGAGVICKTENITGDGEVRLRGSDNRHAGRVEVQLGGVWGTVSDEDWDLNDGHVVCKQLGYLKAVRVFSHSRYGEGNGPTWLTRGQCKGVEENILHCPWQLIMGFRIGAYYKRKAAVQCSNDTHFTSGVEVRLTGMNTSNAGDVHVKYNGTWGTICSSRSALTFKSAQVVCRQLQLGPPVKHSFSHRECTSINEGAETVWLSDLNCQGYEESIDQCPHRGWGKLDPEMCEGCTAITCSVCLICQPVKVSASEFALRLAGSSLPYAGRVEVLYVGVWGLICPRQMSGTVFKVICRQLGFVDVMGDESLYGRPISPHRPGQLYGDANGPVWLSKVRCHGNESHLSQCIIESPGKILWCGHHEALELMCLPRNFTPTYPLRLTGSSVPHAGRLEIFYNATWGTMCFDSWKIHSPNNLVACRQLGFGLPLRSSISWLAPQFSNCPSRNEGSGPIWLSKLSCYGNESSLDQCPHLGLGNQPQCSHTSDACLVCENPRYKDSEIAIKLAGSSVSYAGRVKVRYQGVWGTFCQDSWKTETAEVLCRQLRFKGVEVDITMLTKQEYIPAYIYAEGPGPVWFRGDGCHGDEKSLSECALQQESHCTDELVELICQVNNISISDFPVRLVGNNSNEGRLEVFYGGLWGSISSEKWDLLDAEVLCRQLGYTNALDTYNRKAKEKRVLWFQNFRCRGNEESLGQCRHQVLSRAFHPFDKEIWDVYVRCRNDQGIETGPNPSTKDLRSSLTSLYRTTPIKIEPETASVLVYATSAVVAAPTSTKTLMTQDLKPTKAASTQSTSSRDTSGPSAMCLKTTCKNGGSCDELERTTWKCRCLETFAGSNCEIFVGTNAVSIVLEMTMEQWNADVFRTKVADIFTKHCAVRQCMEGKRDSNKPSQEKAVAFQPDDIIILPGYPKAWPESALLNVRLALRNPGSKENELVAHGLLIALLGNVSSQIRLQLGHRVLYIDKKEVDSCQVNQVPPKKAGRRADEPASDGKHRSALIALGVILGAVCLLAIVAVIVYTRKRNRKRSSLTEKKRSEEEGEHVQLISL